MYRFDSRAIYRFDFSGTSRLVPDAHGRDRGHGRDLLLERLVAARREVADVGEDVPRGEDALVHPLVLRHEEEVDEDGGAGQPRHAGRLEEVLVFLADEVRRRGRQRPAAGVSALAAQRARIDRGAPRVVLGPRPERRRRDLGFEGDLFGDEAEARDHAGEEDQADGQPPPVSREIRRIAVECGNLKRALPEHVGRCERADDERVQAVRRAGIRELAAVPAARRQQGEVAEVEADEHAEVNGVPDIGEGHEQRDRHEERAGGRARV
mmetsp:Transcript_12699/g.39115  ORF Transcript_12699/g.39115 Transcript_12699/m.39115 type:complete len:266 (-) Transcript_12699:1221-2018(-)